MSNATLRYEGKNEIQSAAKEDWAPNEASRVLAGAAHIDSTFRNRSIELDDDLAHAKAPEYGVDRDFVLKHCRLAVERENKRNLFFCLILVSIFIFFIAYASNNSSYTYENDSYPGIFVFLFFYWLLTTSVMYVAELGKEAILTGVLAPQADSGVRLPDHIADPSNVIVYGGFSPFVGSGFDLGGWSLSVNLDRLRNGVTETTFFNIDDLYSSLRESFADLELSSLTIANRLFVDGKQIRDRREILPDEHRAPVDRLSSDIIENLRNSADKFARYYLCITISDWGGHLILSTFIRVKKTKSRLFVEVSNFILPPLKNDFTNPNLYTKKAAGRKTVERFMKCAVSGPLVALVAPLLMLGTWKTTYDSAKWEERINEDQSFNYGAVLSMREIGSENAWKVYFQKLDQEMHRKVVQQQLLECLVDFLDNRGVDTSDLRDRQSYILNHGVIVSGGVITADSIAVGSGSQANTSKASPKDGAKL